MTRKEYDKMFELDNNGCYKYLIIPAEGDQKEINLIGKKPEEYTKEEIIRMKKYSRKMYELIEK